MSQILKKQEVPFKTFGQDDESSRPNLRILVVEDEPEIARAYPQILTPELDENVIPIRSSRQSKQAAPSQNGDLRYQIDIAHSGEQALKLIHQALEQSRPYALGFIDVLLGSGMDGIELVREIQKMDAEMYFVFVTAYQDRSVEAIHELLGPQVAERWDYLTKPFSDGEIIQKARSASSHWNLKRAKEVRDRQVAELQRRAWESERLVSVATVARSMGHEFGNLLVQIIGRAELARKKSEAEMRSAFDLIIKSGEMAAQVLDRFKNLSRSSSLDSHKKLIRLAQPIEDALLLMDHQLKTANIKVTWVKNEPAQVVAVSHSLTQVLVNLLINSVHAMRSSGQIDISIERHSEGVILKVRDYGPGISEENLLEVTKPFFTTKGDEGTGLGLAICKEIIEIEHGGEFSIGNHPIKGVEVVIKLMLPTRKTEDQ